MRLAIVSDTHFGDDQSQLASIINGTPVIGPRYADLVKALAPGVRYLVLAGDILDLSIVPYDKAYACAAVFLQQIQDDGLAEEIIFIPGNHDGDMWHIVQHQRAVINRMQCGRLPKSFQHSVAGIVDDRRNCPAAHRGLTLHGVKAQTGTGHKYAGMFFNHITKPECVVDFVYPNLYIVTDAGSVLVTHGQYLEPYWSILGEIALAVALNQLGVRAVNIEKTIEINFPLNQLACTGVGQAGVLTDSLIRPILIDLKKGNVATLGAYLERFQRWIVDVSGYPCYKRMLLQAGLGKLRKDALSGLERFKQSRYREDFLNDEKVRDRFARYYAASLLEIQAINAAVPFNGSGRNVPPPGRIIFGHTHQPIPWGDPAAPQINAVDPATGKKVTAYNTGGWLADGGGFKGAEVFVYETNTGFLSIPVR